MTDREKLEKIKSLADKMYTSMQNLTSDTTPIRKAMDEYKRFIVHEYHNEEPVSEDIQKVGSLKSLEYYPEKKTTNKTSKGVFDANMPRRKAYLRGFKDGAHAHKELIANKSVSEDLEEAAKTYAKKESHGYEPCNIVKTFKVGANWQKQQMMAKAFDFTKEHNIACVLASECLRNHGWFSRERVFNDLFRHLSCVDKLFEGKFSGKTKVIVIKED